MADNKVMEAQKGTFAVKVCVELCLRSAEGQLRVPGRFLPIVFYMSHCCQ